MASPNPGRVDSFDLVLFLWARRKLIIGLTLLGMVGGVIAAFVIRPLYKSEVILFPAITNSASKALLNEQSTGRDDILALGDAEDAEQLLQVLNSDLAVYGGADHHKHGKVKAVQGTWHGRPYHISMTLPALATMAFERVIPKSKK